VRDWRSYLKNARRLDPAGERLWFQRSAHEESLRVITTEGAQQVPHREIFNAFGDHLQPQVVPQVDGRTHDGGYLGVG
jgi:hypothetical protein